MDLQTAVQVENGVLLFPLRKEQCTGLIGEQPATVVTQVAIEAHAHHQDGIMGVRMRERIHEVRETGGERRPIGGHHSRVDPAFGAKIECKVLVAIQQLL